MKQFVSPILLAVSALVASAPANAITYTYSAVMNAANEPGTVVAPNASGISVVTFDTVALTMAINEVWFGLTGPITVNHIHCCTAVAGTGVANPPIVNFSPTLTSSGSYLQTFTLGTATFNQLLFGASDGKAYVNIHTAANPGGEIRGFLVGPTVPVPEPRTYALMVAGLAGLGLWSRRRQA